MTYKDRSKRPSKHIWVSGGFKIERINRSLVQSLPKPYSNATIWKLVFSPNYLVRLHFILTMQSIWVFSPQKNVGATRWQRVSSWMRLIEPKAFLADDRGINHRERREHGMSLGGNSLKRFLACYANSTEFAGNLCRLRIFPRANCYSNSDRLLGYLYRSLTTNSHN